VARLTLGRPPFTEAFLIARNDASQTTMGRAYRYPEMGEEVFSVPVGLVAARQVHSTLLIDSVDATEQLKLRWPQRGPTDGVIRNGPARTISEEKKRGPKRANASVPHTVHPGRPDSIRTLHRQKNELKYLVQNYQNDQPPDPREPEHVFNLPSFEM
jgi:hypothetical protein